MTEKKIKDNAESKPENLFVYYSFTDADAELSSGALLANCQVARLENQVFILFTCFRMHFIITNKQHNTFTGVLLPDGGECDTSISFTGVLLPDGGECDTSIRNCAVVEDLIKESSHIFNQTTVQALIDAPGGQQNVISKSQSQRKSKLDNICAELSRSNIFQEDMVFDFTSRNFNFD